MSRHRDLAPVGADYATTGPHHNTLHRSIAASADELFRCLEDGKATKEWQGLDVEWTSRPPLGIGSTRALKGLGQTIEQSVLAWEPGRRMCFRNDRTTLPLAAFAEDYVITPMTASACELHWHYAFEWGGRGKPVLGRLFGLAFAIGGRRDLNRLARLLESSAEPD